MQIDPAFFSATTKSVAKKLLGTYLICDTAGGRTAGRIVETEAYLYKTDPASHSYSGKTKRNNAMFASAGHCYVYLIYGMHYCFNIVTGPEGKGEAVLIRALEPIEGIELMYKRRMTKRLKDLCNGPAKLAQAMGITKKHNGISLFDGPIKLLSADSYKKSPISSKQKMAVVKTTRIGVTKGADLDLRFYIKDSSFISRT